MQVCTKCNVVQPDSEFRADKRDRQCKSCKAAYQRNLRASGYRGSGRNKAIKALSQEDKRLHSRLQERRQCIMQRIRKYGTPGTKPSLEDMLSIWEKQEGKCALTGREMSTFKNDSNVVSVDKIDPSKGYVLENIQLSTWSANRAKGDMSMDEFVSMCQDVLGKVQRLS